MQQTSDWDRDAALTTARLLLEIKAINFRLVFLSRSEESFVEAREERLKVSGNPSQYDDLDVFRREQVLMLRLFEESKLEKLHLDVSHNDVARTTDEIVDWMLATGGLYLDGEIAS
jgi:regulator of PEP synthase PpsR (kinase-PPPase family)